MSGPREVSLQEWLDELRSGRWVPHCGELSEWAYIEDEEPDMQSKRKVGNARCCLGVLAEMIGIDYVPSDGRINRHIADQYCPWLSLEAQSKFARANDDMFTPVRLEADHKPIDFGPVIECIEEYYKEKHGDQR